MAEGYVNLFENEWAGTNRPHFKGYLKIDGVDHEFALWPAKEGKKGYSGKFKPKESKPSEEPANPAETALKKEFPNSKLLDDEIPF